MAESGESPRPARESHTARNVGVGCFATFAGLWSGAMVGVLVAKYVGAARECVPPEGLPACEWWVFAGWGAVIGALTLPALVLWRLRRGGAPTDTSARG